ncbi:hypothetical protein [Parapedobacter tibetensis]|uniref:hypothetical protein n=1 Tax=Parapedobacter tibetensis TaxID=2972951 RepID=UPI00214D7C0A|nr:hypothetical protein [Parapedobacter tibetensis]
MTTMKSAIKAAVIEFVADTDKTMRFSWVTDVPVAAISKMTVPPILKRELSGMKKK